mgnify:CR=1 FL=1
MPNQLLANYLAAPDGFDEMLDAAKVPRAHWRAMLDNLEHAAPDMMRQRFEMVQRQVRENGVTYNVTADADGRPFDGQHGYTIRFAPDGLPPVDAFWSLAAYTAADLNLIPNPIDRYSVGDHASGLRMDGDGGMTLYLQPDKPAGGRETNWLPTSPESPWFVLLRMYRPRPAALDGSWRCPGMHRAD